MKVAMPAKVPMTSARGWLRKTSSTGTLTRSLLRIACSKAGVSVSCKRTYRPTNTNRVLSRNGMRQPHSKKRASSNQAVSSKKMPVEQKNPMGAPNCGNMPYQARLPGGAFSPNPFGLYDVVGNVWKWLADAWNPDYVGAPSDGSAWLEGVTVLRGRRGGSWFNISEHRAGDVRAPFRLRSAARFGSLPDLRYSSFGMRVVRDV